MSYIRVLERAQDLRTEENSEGIIEISVPAERRSAVATEGERRSDQLRTEGETDYGKIAGQAGNAESEGDYIRKGVWGPAGVRGPDSTSLLTVHPGDRRNKSVNAEKSPRVSEYKMRRCGNLVAQKI